jgi:hypothetical protein
LGGALSIWAETARQPDPHLYFDVGGELPQHVVEQGDLVAGIATGADRKQIGDALENALALFFAAGCDGVVELVDQRSAFWSAGLRRFLRALLGLEYCGEICCENGNFGHNGTTTTGVIAMVKPIAAKCKDSRNPLSIKADKIAGRTAFFA